MFQSSAPTTEPNTPPAPSREKKPLPALPAEPTRQPLPTPLTPPREDPNPIIPAPGWCPLRQNSTDELLGLTCTLGEEFRSFSL